MDDLERLKQLLKPEIEWYKKHLKEDGEDYVYDESLGILTSMDRGIAVDILEILARTPPEHVEHG